MYSTSSIHCVACGSLIPRARRDCPSCQQPNLYRRFIPGEHPRGLLSPTGAEPTEPMRIPASEYGPPPTASQLGGAPHYLETTCHPPSGSDSAGPEEERIHDRKTEKLPLSRPEGSDRATVRMQQAYPADLMRTEPPGQPERFRLEKGRLVLGYSFEVCDLVLREDTVSEQHAELLCEEDDRGQPVVYIRDLASTNGTFVNTERIGSEARRVHDGDQIGFADICYQLRVRGRRVQRAER